MADLNRVKTVLAERGIMSKWLAKTLSQIADVLNVRYTRVDLPYKSGMNRI